MDKPAGQRTHTVTTINGVRVSKARAVISVFDNSLLYGEGLFETLLAVDNRVFFLKEHLDRLERGAKVIGLKLQTGRRQLTQWMAATAAAHPAHVKQVRVTVTSGESARYVGAAGEPQVIVSAAPLRRLAHPYRLLVSRWRVDQDSVFRQIKTISYAINAAALRVARQRGFDEALLLNQHGEVAEVSTANIFWVKRGRIYTPPLSAGCLEGTTRKTLLRMIKRAGYQLVEKTESLEEMADADEAFISSSLKLVAAVAEIQGRRRVFRFQSGPITAELRGKLEHMVGL